MPDQPDQPDDRSVELQLLDLLDRLRDDIALQIELAMGDLRRIMDRKEK